MSARKTPPLPPRWFEITVIEGTRAYRKIVALMGAAMKRPDYQVSAEATTLMTHTFVRRRRRGRGYTTTEKRPACAMRVRIEKVPADQFNQQKG